MKTNRIFLNDKELEACLRVFLKLLGTPGMGGSAINASAPVLQHVIDRAVHAKGQELYNDGV